MLRLNSILCGWVFVFIVGMPESLAVKLDQHEVLHVCTMPLRVTHCPRSTWRELGVNSVPQPEMWKKIDGSNRSNLKLRLDLLVGALLAEVFQRVRHPLMPRPHGFARPSTLLAALGLRARSLDYISSC